MLLKNDLVKKHNEEYQSSYDESFLRVNNYLEQTASDSDEFTKFARKICEIATYC